MHEPLPRRTVVQAGDSGVDVAIDTETRSKADLRKVGPHEYASDPSTEIACLAYALNDGPVRLCWPGDPCPPEILEVAHNPKGRAYAHNAQFDMTVLERVLVLRHGWPTIPLQRWRCTMAMCQALGLPARLSAAADALELANRKDVAGERLMRQASRPRKPRKDEDPAGTYWHDDPERLRRLGGYCVQDCEVLRELFYRLPQLSPAEQAVWVLSCQINQRGFHVDLPFAEAARRIAEAAAPEIDAELAELTGGAVTGINQVARLTRWLQAQGL